MDLHKRSDFLVGIQKWLRPYIERNSNFEDFKRDCGIMGGSFEYEGGSGFLEISNGKVEVRDWHSSPTEVVFKCLLQEIWEDKTQLTLI